MSGARLKCPLCWIEAHAGNPNQIIDPYTRCMRLPYDEIHSAIAPWHGPLMEQYKTKEDLCRHVIEDLESYTEDIEMMKQDIEHLNKIKRRRDLNEEEQEALDFNEGHMEYSTSLVSAIKELLTARAPEIEAMAMNHPFIHVDSADVKETFTYSDHPVAIVDAFEFGGTWNPKNRLIMFDTKTWGSINEEEKRILLDHEIVERGLAMEDYAQYRSHSDAVEANHAKANAILSERYGAEAIDDLIARGLLAK